MRSLPQKPSGIGGLRDSNAPRTTEKADLGSLFDDRQSRLPDSNVRRTDSTYFNRLFWAEDDLNRVILLWEDFSFGQVNGAKGVRLILTPTEVETVRSRQRRWQEAKPPPIQIMLKQAYELGLRLDQTPGLTRTALANELAMNPSYLTRLLNLLNLAPEIQRYILSLPPNQTKGPITESRIKHLARIADPHLQLKEFEALKSLPARSSFALA